MPGKRESVREHAPPCAATVPDFLSEQMIPVPPLLSSSCQCRRAFGLTYNGLSLVRFQSGAGESRLNRQRVCPCKSSPLKAAKSGMTRQHNPGFGPAGPPVSRMGCTYSAGWTIFGGKGRDANLGAVPEARFRAN